jgi:hypothetical protein
MTDTNEMSPLAQILERLAHGIKISLGMHVAKTNASIDALSTQVGTDNARLRQELIHEVGAVGNRLEERVAASSAEVHREVGELGSRLTGEIAELRKGVGTSDRPLLTPEEIDRITRAFGPDTEIK